jgi:PAS domain S-box-containing protein
MASRFSKIFAPPIFEGEEKTRVARLLHIILFGTLAVTLLVIFFQPLLSPNPVPRLLFIGLFALLEIGGLLMIRRGRVAFVVQVLPAAMWLLLTAVTLYSGGVRTTSFISYTIVIILASLIGGSRVGIVYGAISVLAGLGFLLGELNGLLPPALIPTTSISIWVGLAANFLIAALLLHLATSSITEALNRARRNQAELHERNLQLQAQALTLESREGALKISETRLRLAMESTNLGTWAWELPTDQLNWSENVESILDLPPGSLEHTFNAYLALVSLEDREVVRKQISDFVASVQDGSRFSIEHRVSPPNGRLLWVEVNGAMSYSQDGKPIRMVGTILDISDRKRAEEDRLKNHQRLSQALRAAQAGAWEWDIRSDQTYWSEENYEILGLPSGPPESTYHRWLERVHPDDREAATQQIEEVVETHKDLNIEFRVVWPDGSVHWIQDVGKLVVDETGKPIQMFGIQMDISERKRAEEALQRSADRLSTLHDIDQAILAAESPEEIVAATLQNLRSLIPGELLSVSLFDFPGNSLRLIGHKDGPDLGAQTLTDLPLDPSLPLAQIREGEIYELIDPASQQPTPGAQLILGIAEFKSGFLAPILSKDDLIGTINMASERANAFTPEHREIAREVATSLGVALQTARLVNSLQRYSRQLETLRQASLHLTSDLALEPVLNGVLEYALALTAADDAHIFLYDESRDRLTFGAAHWAGGRQEKPYANLRPEGLTYTVARNGQRIVAPDVDNHPLFKDWPWGGAIIGLPLGKGKRINGVMTVAFEKPHDFPEDEMRILDLLADQAAIAIQNAQLFTREHRQTQRLEALLRVGLALSIDLELESLLLFIVQQAIDLLGGTAGGMYLHDPEEDLLVWRVLSGENLAPMGSTLRKGEGLSGSVWKTGQLINVDDYQEWEGKTRAYEAFSWRSVIGVPVSRKDQFFGVIDILADQPGAFSDSDAKLLNLFAAQTAIAIENARLFQSTSEQGDQLRDLTAQLASLEEDERTQLSRELHDRVGQNLTALSINLSMAKSLLPENAADLKPRLDDSQRLVAETAQHIRDVMAELRPPVLDDYGLLAALRWYCDRFAHRAGIQVQVEGQEISPRLPLTAETALFRINQEALNNISRHAGAQSVTVTLSSSATEAVLTITDNGTGFDTLASENTAGWGLRIMQERAETVDGHLTLVSSPREGTRIQVQLPR